MTDKISMGSIMGWLLAVAAIFLLTSAPLSAAEIKLKYAGTLPVTHHLGEAQYKFAKLVAEKTGGKVEIEVYPASQLYGARQIPTAVVSGGADIGFDLTGVWSTDPVSELSDVPFLYRDAKHAATAWNRKGKLYQAFSEAMAKKGLKVIHVMFFGSLFDFGNNVRQLRGASDFKGMKIRSYGKLAAEGLRALGASPTVMSPGEMYLALQRGTVDGVITGVTSLEERKIWEVAKFATITHATFGIFAVNMSMTKYASLPKDVQQALEDAGQEIFTWSIDESQKRDESSQKFLIEKGIHVYLLTDADKQAWAKSFEPAYKAWESRANDEQKALYAWVKSLK